MHKTALQHAWESLHEAQAAQTRLANSRSFAEAERAWKAFLMAAGTIYSKLEKGTRGHNKAEPWFGTIKHERKKDELLSYVHHARNTAEHGITDITDRKPGHFAITGDVHIHNLTINGGNISGKIEGINPRRPMGVEVVPPRLRLVPVFDDLHGDTFQVPTEHLGVKLDEPTPLAVASLALTYLDRIVREASKFSK